MLWIYGHYEYFFIIQRGDWLQMSESDVYRILTCKVDPGAERIIKSKTVFELHAGPLNKIK